MVQNLPSNAGGVGSISNWEAKISHALQPKNQNTEQKQYCNTFNKVLKIKKKKKTEDIRDVKTLPTWMTVVCGKDWRQKEKEVAEDKMFR